LERAKRTRDEAAGMKAEADRAHRERAQRDVDAAQQMVNETLNKLDAELHKQQIAFIRASLRHTFTQKVVDTLNALIGRNQHLFAPIAKGWEAHQKEMDASRDAIRAELKRMFPGGEAVTGWRTPAAQRKNMLYGTATAKYGFDGGRTEVKNKDGDVTSMERLTKLMEDHGKVLFKRGVINKSVSTLMNDARITKFLAEDLKLQMELADEVKALARAQQQLNRATATLEQAHASQQADPAKMAPLRESQALLTEAREQLNSETPDMTAGRELLGEQDATVKAITADIKALSDDIIWRKSLAEGMERNVRERAEARTKQQGETQREREAKDAEERQREQQALERADETPQPKGGTVPRTKVTFEPARRLEAARERANQRVAALEEQEATGTPEERAAATAELAKRRAEVERKTAGAQKKLQTSIAYLHKLEERLKNARAALENAKTDQAKENIKAKIASLQQQVIDQEARVSLRRGNERIPVLSKAERAGEAQSGAPEPGERLPARREGPLVKKAQMAGNPRTGDLAMTEERTLSQRNPVQQSGNPKSPTAKQAMRAGNKEAAKTRPASLDGWLREQMRLEALVEKVEEALAKAQLDGDKTAIANRTEQLARVKRAHASAEGAVNRMIASTKLASMEDDVGLDEMDPVRLWKEKPVEPKVAKKEAPKPAPAPAPAPAASSPERQSPAEYIDKRYDGELDESAPFNGMTFAEAARFGAQRSSSPLVKALFNKLAETFDTAPPDQAGRVYALAAPIGRNGNWHGIYSADRNEAYALTPGWRTGTNKTLLHELAHAATVRALYLNPELAKRVRDLRDQVQTWMELPEGKEYFRKHRMELGKGRSDIYALTNEREFIAELFADRGFQRMLASIPSAQPKKSIFTKFVELLSKFFGGKDDVSTSVFAEAMALAEEVLEKTRTEVHGKDAWAKRKAGFTSSPDPLVAPALTYGKEWRAIGATADSIVARERPLHERLRAHGSGLAFETKLVDRFAALERMSKQMDSLAGTQMMFFARMYDQRFHHVAQSVGSGVTQRVEIKRADGRHRVRAGEQEGRRVSLRGVVSALQAGVQAHGRRRRRQPRLHDVPRRHPRGLQGPRRR
jgi:hypothetical protein